MRLAETLLRAPAATWALLFTGRIITPADLAALSAQRMVAALAGRIGAPR